MNARPALHAIVATVCGVCAGIDIATDDRTTIAVALIVIALLNCLLIHLNANRSE